MNNIPNLMYLFTTNEAIELTQIYADKASSTKEDVVIHSLSFLPDDYFSYETPPNPADILDKDKNIDTLKIIYNARFPSTIKTPHHILPNGEQQHSTKHTTAFRTYFDGSYIDKLSHAVAIGIDHKNKSITTQCPHGDAFSDDGEIVLQSIYPNYERVTIRHKQQQDEHSCVPLTLHNIFSMANFHEPQDSISILEWRKELLRTLEEHSIQQYSEADMDNLTPERFYASLERINKKDHGNPNPIWTQRYQAELHVITS